MGTETDQPMPGSMGIDEAADYLVQRREAAAKELDSEEDTEEQSDADVKDADEEVEDRESDSDPDEDVEEEDDESDDSDDDEESDEDTPDSDDEPDDDFVFKIKDEESGEEVKVNAEEARLGYLRQRDYTQKTQRLASEQKEVQGLKDELIQQKGQVAQALDQLSQAANQELAEFAGVDWEKLERDDPYEYEEKARRYDALKRKHDQAMDYQKQLAAEYQEELQGRLQEIRDQEQRTLLEKAPEFDPEAGGEELHQRLLSVAQDQYGFTMDELDQIFDHRALLVLRDAQKYHELKGKLEKGKSKGKKTQKTIKPSAKTSQKTRKQKDTDRLRSRMHKSHSMDDALEFLMAGQRARK